MPDHPCRPTLAALLAVTLCVGALARADEFAERLDEAQKAYRVEDYDTAIAALEAALAQARTHKAQVYVHWLPAPPDGWQAGPVQAGASSQPVNGGIHVERTYTREDASVQVAITGEAPWLQGLGAVFANPAALGKGLRYVEIDGRRAIHDPADNLYRVLVGNDAILVEVHGNAAVREPAIKAFLRGVDFATIEKSLR